MKKGQVIFLACIIALLIVIQLSCNKESDSKNNNNVSGELDCTSLPQGKLANDCNFKGKADRWDAANNPDSFDVTMKRIASELPNTGRATRIPWPDTYWATYEDGVNYRWQGLGVLSPIEKYDVAFNGWTPSEGFMDLKPFSGCGRNWDKDYYDKLGPAAKYWSTNKGNKKQRDMCNGTDCEDGCDDKIETWWGLCHAWVPAAILEDEPQKSVTYNGVTFDVSDIKALLIMMYNRSNTKFLGKRCNLKDKDITRDETGRITQSECRDTNAGSFHLVITNMLGIHKRAFAEDRTMDYEVWNQPVLGYDIELMEPIDLKQAVELMGEPDATEYRWNTDAEKFYEVVMNVDYITESSPESEPLIDKIDQYTRTDKYHYILECESDGTIIGGEWISSQNTAFPDRISYTPNSQTLHADFLWLPLSAGYSSNPHANLDKIRMLVEMSRSDTPEEPEGNVSIFKSTGIAEIPDNNDDGVQSTINVPDDIQINGLKIKVDIEHTYIGDLKIDLIYNGKTVNIQDNAGGSSDNIQKTYPVHGFSGSAQGDWNLKVVDNASSDTGKILSWELIVKTGDIVAESWETFSSNETLDITDNDETGVTSKINITNSISIKELQVQVDISHTYISDLKVELRFNGITSILHNREGDDNDNIIKTYTVTDFNGSDIAGNWELFVSDNAAQDTGKLNSWSVKVKK